MLSQLMHIKLKKEMVFVPYLCVKPESDQSVSPSQESAPPPLKLQS